MQNVRSEVLSKIQEDDKVLDIGAWNDIFPRADWIIDLGSYETRTNNTGEQERFSKDTWIIGDINSPEVWEKFPDKFFDFVICSHLLEDIRDPVFVCRQLIRVAKRGYIEVPSRFRECARVNPLETCSGYDHHRWIVDVVDGDLAFTAKLHWANTLDYLPRRLREHFFDFKVQFTAFFWENSFGFYERIPKGERIEGANILHYYDNFDIKTHNYTHAVNGGEPRSDVIPGSTLWVTEYSLPVETADELGRYISEYERRLRERGMLATSYDVNAQL